MVSMVERFWPRLDVKLGWDGCGLLLNIQFKKQINRQFSGLIPKTVHLLVLTHSQTINECHLSPKICQAVRGLCISVQTVATVLGRIDDIEASVPVACKRGWVLGFISYFWGFALVLFFQNWCGACQIDMLEGVRATQTSEVALEPLWSQARQLRISEILNLGDEFFLLEHPMMQGKGPGNSMNMKRFYQPARPACATSCSWGPFAVLEGLIRLTIFLKWGQEVYSPFSPNISSSSKR